MKGIIFDLDGTLVNTLADINHAVNAMLEDYGIPVQTFEDTKNHLGLGFEFLVEQSLPENKKDLFEEALAKFLYYYDQYYMEETKPYDGIKELLIKLQDEGYKLAINSNKRQEYTEKLVKKCFPEINFVDIIGARFDEPKKPDPKMALEIVKEMNLNKDEVIFVGDSNTDYKTALNGGFYFVACDWGFGFLNLLPLERIAYTSSDLYNYIKNA